MFANLVNTILLLLVDALVVMLLTVMFATAQESNAHSVQMVISFKQMNLKMIHARKIKQNQNLQVN